MQYIPSFTKMHASVKRHSNHFAEAIIHGFAVSNPSPYNPHPPFTPEQFERFIHNIAYAVSMLTILCLIAVAILSIPATGGASPTIFLALLAGPPLAGAALMTLTCMFRNASVRFQQFREFNKEFHDKTCKIRLLIKHYLSVRKLGNHSDKVNNMKQDIRKYAPEIVKLECMAETYKYAYLQRKIDALEEENKDTPDVEKSKEIENLEKKRDTITPNNITSFIHVLFSSDPPDEDRQAFIAALKLFPFFDHNDKDLVYMLQTNQPDYHSDKAKLKKWNPPKNHIEVKKEGSTPLNSLITKCLKASLESEKEGLIKRLKELNEPDEIVSAIMSLIHDKIGVPQKKLQTIHAQLIKKVQPLEHKLEKRLNNDMEQVIDKVITSLAEIITPSNKAFQPFYDFIGNEKLKQSFLLLDTITFGLTTFFVGVVSSIMTPIIDYLFGKEHAALKPDELMKLAKKTTIAKLKEGKDRAAELRKSMTKSLDNVDVDSLSEYLEVADDVVDQAVVVFKSGNQIIDSWVNGVSQDTLHYDVSLHDKKLQICKNIQEEILELMKPNNRQNIDVNSILTSWKNRAAKKEEKISTDLSLQNLSDETPHDKTRRDFILKQERFLKARIKHRDGNRDKQRGKSEKIGQKKSSSNKNRKKEV